MNVNDLIEISRKHDYKELSCVVDGELITFRKENYYGVDKITFTFQKLEIDQKNVSFVGAIRGKDILIMLINASNDPNNNTEDEQDSYEAVSCYGFVSKTEVLKNFPDYPYNDEYRYAIIDEYTFNDYCGMDEEEWEDCFMSTTIDEMVKAARKHRYNEISCVIGDEIVTLEPNEPYDKNDEEFTCRFHKVPTEKNVWLNVAILDNTTLVCIINLSENSKDPDEQDRYNSIKICGIASKSEVLSIFPDYPYNDDYLYCIKNGID